MCNTFGFSNKVKLTEALEFKRVFSKAKAYNFKNIKGLVRTNEGQTARLGVIVAKKNVRKASQRSRIKRLIRESFRIARPTLPAIDIIVMARFGANSSKNSEIFECLNKLWAKLSASRDD